MRSFRLMALLAMCLMLLAAPVQAKTTITFWHGMGGELGEITDEMIKEFNASQDKYEVKGVYKGNYDEAMTAAIAAFRAKQHPNLIQIFEVGTASMDGRQGAIRPVYEIMEAAGTPVDTSKLLRLRGQLLLLHGRQAHRHALQRLHHRPLLQQGRREEGRRRPGPFPHDMA